MVRGLYTAASGALVAQMNADTIANNLANVNTGGFKRTLLQVESDPTLGISRIQTDPGKVSGNATPGVPAVEYVGQLGLGAQVYDTPAIFEQGSLSRTENPLDIGLKGPGFFAVQTPRGVRYTRDGAFVRNLEGLMVTQSGDLVLGRNGAIPLPAAKIDVDQRGNISANGVPLDQLRIVEFPDTRTLRSEGGNLFLNTDGPPINNRTTSVHQGTLEMSNANVVESMVGLITAERAFEANEKVIQTEDDAVGQAITTVGRTATQ